MNNIKLKILGIPFSKQADRSRIANSSKGNFVHHYKSKKVKKGEKNVRTQAISQLPEGFVPYDEPIGIKALFVFPMLKSFPKYKREMLENGGQIYKETKPDLTDNLMKGLCDALEGVVFINDSRIAKVESEKIFGFVPRIELEIYKLAGDSSQLLEKKTTPLVPLFKEGMQE